MNPPMESGPGPQPNTEGLDFQAPKQNDELELVVPAGLGLEDITNTAIDVTDTVASVTPLQEVAPDQNMEVDSLASPGVVLGALAVAGTVAAIRSQRGRSRSRRRNPDAPRGRTVRRNNANHIITDPPADSYNPLNSMAIHRRRADYEDRHPLPDGKEPTGGKGYLGPAMESRRLVRDPNHFQHNPESEEFAKDTNGNHIPMRASGHTTTRKYGAPGQGPIRSDRVDRRFAKGDRKQARYNKMRLERDRITESLADGDNILTKRGQRRILRNGNYTRSNKNALKRQGKRARHLNKKMKRLNRVARLRNIRP